MIVAMISEYSTGGRYVPASATLSFQLIPLIVTLISLSLIVDRRYFFLCRQYRILDICVYEVKVNFCFASAIRAASITYVDVLQEDDLYLDSSRTITSTSDRYRKSRSRTKCKAFFTIKDFKVYTV